MSDVEDSKENGYQSDEASEAAGSRERSASRSLSRSRGSRSRSRSYSRSRSRSRSHNKRYASRSRSRSPQRRRSRYSRSRSGSRSPRRGYRSRRRSSRDRGHRSRSPMSNRRRHMGNREDPEPSRCIGIFGLSLYTQERDLKEVFARYGPVDEVQVVYDHQTGRSRGFAFLYYKEADDARTAKERCNGLEIDGRRIRVDFSITKRPHTPTPGIYLGKPTGRGRRYDRRDRRSPPQYYRRRGYSSRYSRSRSRSRSYSPRRDRY